MIVSAPKAKRVPVKKSTLAGLLAFGETNLFPQNLITICKDSVTAGGCLSVRAEFIEGNGFLETDLANMVMHRSGLTLDTVLNRIAWNVAVFEIIALHVGYNGLGKIAFIRPVPVEFIRLCEPDEMGIITHGAICPYLDGGYNARKKNQFVKLPLFNPDPAVVLEQMADAGGIDAYQGQLLYEPFWTPGDSYYHEPSYLTAIRAIESEGQLDLFDWKTITSGFNVSGILTILGKPKTPGKEYDPYLDTGSIEYQISDNQGAENAAQVMVIRAENETELANIKFFDITGANLSERYLSTGERVESRITRAMRVPNELANIRRTGGIAPTGEEIKVASQLMYQTVNRYQRKIAQVFSIILRNWKIPVALDPAEPCKIENLNYFPDGDGAVTTTAPAATAIPESTNG